MKYLNLSLPTPAENLACDEALLDLCEEGTAGEILRFWQTDQVFVVLGYANSWQSEVNVEACREFSIPVFRRSSGGGTVLQGPGCLNYSLILKIEPSGPFQSIHATNNFIMRHQKAALDSIFPSGLQVQGFTDLTLANLKFSGNAQRRRKNALLFHGTFLLNFDLSLIQTFLAMPARQPDYRQVRPHRNFLTNLAIPAETMMNALKNQWKADEPFTHIPHQEIQKLAQSKYNQEEWNFKF